MSRPLNVNRDVSFEYGLYKSLFMLIYDESELSISPHEYIAQ